jgi:hypothetical protein
MAEMQLAVHNACIERDTARERHWQLLCDLKAVEKASLRKLNFSELLWRFR